jgi:lactate dehydrogenase-like 2-hydroxyacid dehydrogenase
MSQHGYTQWWSYQPASRYWPLQGIEGSGLLLLAILLVAGHRSRFAGEVRESPGTVQDKDLQNHHPERSAVTSPLACASGRSGGCQRLPVVAATLKGYDNFGADACARHGIRLTIVPDTVIAPTAELAIGLVIGLMRKIPQGDARVRGGGYAGWRPQLYGATLSGATAGIMGMGQLGQAIARRLAGFEAEIIYHDARPLGPGTEQAPAASCRSLEQVAQSSDVLIVALPGAAWC